MVRIGPFLERIEAVFIAVWLSIAFLNGSVLMHCSAQCLQELCRRLDRRVTNLAAFVIIWAGALWVNDMARMLLQQWLISNVLTWVMLALLLLIRLRVAYKQRKEAKHVQT